MEYLLHFIITLTAIMLGFLFKNYYPKYFETKGANRATKEDIGEITKIAESIKIDLQKQNELIKAKLAFENSHKLNIKSVEREAIFEFNKTLSAWIESIARFENIEYDLENYKEIKNSIRDLSRRKYEYDLAYAHLSLIIDDEELNSKILDIVLASLHLEDEIRNIMNHLFDLCELTETRGINVSEEKEISIMEQFFKGKELLLNLYSKKINDKYDNITQLKIEIINILRKRIKILEDNLKEAD